MSDFDYDARMAEVELLMTAVDPDRTPFASKYLAVDKLKDIDEKLVAQLKAKGADTAVINEKLAKVRYNSGVIHFATEETNFALDALKSFLSLQVSSSPNYLQSSNAYRLIDANNTLCMIMFQREEFEEAEKFLKDAEKVYEAFSSSNAASRSLVDEIESGYTTTCLYFAQVYAKLESAAQSATYVERTLVRSYESGVYDPLEIAQFCLQITSYYQSECRWRQSLYSIAAAHSISKPVQDAQLYAEISLYMGKFFSEYLESQREKQAYMPSLTEEVLMFKGLKLDETFVLDQLGAKIITDDAGKETHVPKSLGALASAAQADAWASQGCTWFSRALYYFVLDGFTTEHVTICLERDHMLSVAMDYFGASEPKLRKQYLLRRASYLEPLIEALSPNHFFSLVQQLLFTLGEIYEHLVDMSTLPLTDGLIVPPISPQAKAQAPNALPLDERKAAKVNKRVSMSVRFYQRFLDTLMPEGQLPPQLEKGVIESFFRAHLSLAKLHQRFRSTNKQLLIMMARKSASYYRLVDSLARAYKPQFLQAELKMCPELHRLLNMKADALEKTL